MPFSSPVSGMVIRYSYLWKSEHEKGLEEGAKDRPCAVVLLVTDNLGGKTVTVLPITHIPPAVAELAVEIPAATKRRLGLDDDRSWVLVNEANRFLWPGSDVRPLAGREPGNVAYGLLPFALFEQVQTKFLHALKAHQTGTVARTE